MKKIILILSAILLMSFIGLNIKSETKIKEPTTFTLQDEPYVDDIPFDTKAVVDSLKNNN